MKLSTGEWVEVRSKEEILRTLDNEGRLEGMPFMPEMFEFCGKRFQVYKRAHKTCDTVFPIRGRRLVNAVHLETRCSGEAHGGCQAGCLIFWKNAWLRRVNDPSATSRMPAQAERQANSGCTEQQILNASRGCPEGIKDDADAPYVCQATRLPYATVALNPWDIRQYLEDYTSGNVSLHRILSALTYSLTYNLSEAGIGLGRTLRWLYDKLHWFWGGTLFPWHTGRIPPGEPTPSKNLNLQPGELVRVKSHQEILKTLNMERKNRGMYFDAEMVPYCGQTFRVLKRVNRILDEKTGKMVRLKSEAIVLDGVICQSRYSYCRMLCPRAIYSYWREIWLERVEAPVARDVSVVGAVTDENRRPVHSK
jgi:hypothetical protein